MKATSPIAKQRTKRGDFFAPRLASPREKLSPPRPALAFAFFLRPRPASPRQNLSPPRPAPSYFYKNYFI